jgi:hypothetical protein
MAVRKDWTRITQSIHNFISTLIPFSGRTSETSCTIIPGPQRAQRTMTLVRNTMTPRLLAEIERKRNQAYMSSLRNQIRQEGEQECKPAKKEVQWTLEGRSMSRLLHTILSTIARYVGRWLDATRSMVSTTVASAGQRGRTSRRAADVGKPMSWHNLLGKLLLGGFPPGWESNPMFGSLLRLARENLTLAQVYFKGHWKFHRLKKILPSCEP